MNKFQILGIIAVGLAVVSVGAFYVYKPVGDGMTKSSPISLVLLALAVAATAIAMILSQSKGIASGSESYVPHMVHQPQQQHQQQQQDFIMREGLKKPDAEAAGKGGKSLGRRLKDAGWEVVFADWCGFCVKQKDMFRELASEELDLIVLAEGDMTDAHKALNEGFPAFMCVSKNLKSPGYKADIEQIEALLEMK
jgi:thiol-disulfide isomerase/thioredoxin